jgi:hypothetical protein
MAVSAHTQLTVYVLKYLIDLLERQQQHICTL